MNRAKYIANIFSIGYMMAFAVVFSGCYKGSDCPDSGSPVTTEYKIPASQKAFIPYSATGPDTLTYESEHGDIAVLYGKGVRNSFDTFPVNRSSDPGCPFYDYDYLQTLIYRYEGTSSLLNEIIFKVFVGSDLTHNIYVEPSISNRIYFGALDNLSAEVNYLDTVIINGTVYPAKGLCANNEVDTSLFYNKHYGILRLKSGNLVWRKRF